MESPDNALMTESEALRNCNLPSTPRWRSFLRDKMPARAAGSSTVYLARDVRSLADKIADFAAETMPLAEHRQNSTAIDRSTPSVELHTR